MSRRRLGYLFKHAQLRLTRLTGPALEPLGIDGRELAVLTVLDARSPVSQQQAAQELRIDRTTMVAMVDALERKGLVARRPHPDDRRKNAVELTERGRDVLTRGAAAVEEAERAYLEPLTEDERRVLRAALDRLATDED
ncbi:MarR family winged helix-turn-helix transcriptional regulator [Nonomuraea roseoviolacea]|uniref:DNA-binding MarR family transcriptional regulator n=1 Tax=Nonomuraea roseoviolacea subsp. carminata TaxID=160689 RepID=A0ABT1K8D4_9ACTN|nr:MarR family transcriptional regulator [Nonomuraea roseoviolacea]MCP2350265.1 DNA-binding MarR family transcriptional regulator [Nonomuraea roseoviolacea subsp. carminata]